MRLTAKERAFLLHKADVDGDGAISEHEFASLVRGQQLPVLERRTLLELRDQAHVGSLGQQMVVAADFLGTALFSVVGAQIAGQAGMHVVGCTLVGCVAGMGGGTLNNVMIGRTPVFWQRDSRFLLVAVLASVATFYLWPEYEAWAARRELRELTRRFLDGEVGRSPMYHSAPRTNHYDTHAHTHTG